MVPTVYSVHQWLKKKRSVTVPDDWLEACIDWIHAENSRGVLSDELCSLVYEQWLLADLEEIGAQCLPPEITTSEKLSLKGVYSLQVQSVVDVSQSYYSQLQKVQGTENENVEVTATQATQQSQVVIHGSVLCRMGVMMLKKNNITILGGEVESLLEQNTPIQLLGMALKDKEEACKNGPRSNEQHWEGGTTKQAASGSGQLQSNKNVGKTMNTHSVSQRALPSLTNTYSASQRALPSPTNTYSVSRGVSSTQADINDLQHQQSQFSDDDLLDHMGEDQLKAMERQVSVHGTHEKIKDWEDDVDYDVLMEQLDFQDTARSDIDTVGVETPRSTASIRPQDTKNVLHPRSSSSTCIRVQKTSASVAFNSDPSPQRGHLQVSSGVGQSGSLENISTHNASMDISRDNKRPALTININVRQSKPENKQTLPQIQPHQPHLGTTSSVTTSHNGSISKRMKLEQVDSPAATNVFSQHCSLFTGINIINTEPPPFIYLSQVISTWPPPVKKTFIVKAYISTLLSRLDHQNGAGWVLTAKLNDGSAAVDVDLGDAFLTGLIGFSASQCMAYRAQAKKDRSVKTKVTQAIQHCQQQLIQLSCLLELEMCPSRPRSFVLARHNITKSHILQLRAHTSSCR